MVIFHHVCTTSTLLGSQMWSFYSSMMLRAGGRAFFCSRTSISSRSKKQHVVSVFCVLYSNSIQFTCNNSFLRQFPMNAFFVSDRFCVSLCIRRWLKLFSPYALTVHTWWQNKRSKKPQQKQKWTLPRNQSYFKYFTEVIRIHQYLKDAPNQITALSMVWTEMIFREQYGWQRSDEQSGSNTNVDRLNRCKLWPIQKYVASVFSQRTENNCFVHYYSTIGMKSFTCNRWQQRRQKRT